MLMRSNILLINLTSWSRFLHENLIGQLFETYSIIIHKSMTLVCVLSYMNPLCPVPYRNSSLPRMPDDPPHLILLDLITLLIFGKESNHEVLLYAVFTIHSAVTSICFDQNATKTPFYQTCLGSIHTSV